MTQEASGEDALLELRRDMMEFILQELAARAATGSHPALSDGLAETLSIEINAAVEKAMQASRRGEATEIARLVAEALDGQTRLQGAGESRRPTGPAKQTQIRRAAPSRIGRLLDWAKQRTWLTVVLVLAVVALMLLGGVLLKETIRLRQLQDDATAAQANSDTALTNACQQAGRIRDQLRSLADTAQYRATCPPGQADGAQNALCAAVDRTMELASQSCPAAGSR